MPFHLEKTRALPSLPDAAKLNRGAVTFAILSCLFFNVGGGMPLSFVAVV